MSILLISKQYKQRPSDIIGITNDYEAFCFDECCAYILSELSKENHKEPKFDDGDNKNNTDNSEVIAWLNSNNKS